MERKACCYGATAFLSRLKLICSHPGRKSPECLKNAFWKKAPGVNGLKITGKVTSTQGCGLTGTQSPEVTKLQLWPTKVLFKVSKRMPKHGVFIFIQSVWWLQSFYIVWLKKRAKHQGRVVQKPVINWGGVYIRKLAPERVSHWDDFLISYRLHDDWVISYLVI